MIFIIIISLYSIAIGYFIVGFDRLKSTSEIKSTENPIAPFTKFSIIVPFRNEAQRLPQLLNSLSKLNYPEDCFEVLLINDASTDESVTIVENFKDKNPNIILRLFDNQRITPAPKKDAISLAITKANYEWILTTDADCLLPSNWLNCYQDYIFETNYAFIAGPVIYKNKSSFIDQYQILDILSLQGVTIGSFGQGRGLLCNGANLGYTKTLFNALDGFKNNNKIASGDDVFMLENAQAKFPEKVGYLKSRLAIVETFPETTWKDLIVQRTRWAKKTSKQKGLFTKILGVLVFLANICVLILPVVILMNPYSLWFGLSALGLKLLIDAILLKKTAGFYSKHISVVQIFTHFYVYAIISTWIVLSSPFNNYSWKGRLHRH